MNLEQVYLSSLDKAYEDRKAWLSDALRREIREELSSMDYRHISDKEYEDIILPYWSRYGRRPDKFFFEYDGAKDGRIDPRFIPHDFYYTELVPYLNNLLFSNAIKDKSYQDIMFKDAKQAKTVCRSISGEFYDIDMNNISRDEAVDLCLNPKAILYVKPATYTSRGRGISVIDNRNRNKESIISIMENTGANFIIQEKILQHPDLASLCPDTVNTIRVVTLFIESKIYVTNMDIRIGSKGQQNISFEKGGYDACINKDGTVDTRIRNHGAKWFDAEELGLFKKGFTIPSFDRMISLAGKLHKKLPHFKLIGWDFTIDEESDPVLVECNFAPGITTQISCGESILGEMTDWILDDFFINRKLEKNHMQRQIIQ